MTETSKQKMCLIHKQEGLAVDLNLSSCHESRYLCSRCLTEKFLSKSSCAWVKEAEEMIIDMKQREKQQQIQCIQQKQEKLTNLQIALQNYLDCINNGILKIISQLNEQIEVIKAKLDKISNTQESTFQDEDIINLSQYLNEEEIITTSNILNSDDNIQDNQFIQLIKEQLERQFTGNEHQKVIMLLNEMLKEKNDEQNLNKKSENLEIQQSEKTLSLSQRCSKHDKEIIMVTIDNGSIDERLFCSECLSKCINKLTSLLELNTIWKEHKGQEYDCYRSFHQLRQDKFEKLQEILKQMQKNYQSIQNEMNEQLKLHNQSILQELNQLELNKLKKTIQQLGINEIRKVVSTLAQNDRMEKIQEQVSKFESSDQSFHQGIVQKFVALDKNLVDHLLLWDQTISYSEAESRIQLRKSQSKILKTNGFKFSQELKHQSINLSSDKKTANLQNQDTVCLCNIPIFKYGQYFLDFKIKTKQIAVGICLKEFVPKEFKLLELRKFENGFYLLHSDGFINSHHDQNLNWKGLGFRFSSNDIIRVEVNLQQKEITWKNLFTNQYYTMEICNDSEIYFCVLVNEDNQQIQIV